MMHFELLHVYEIIENIFPPIPSEFILPLAGSLTSKGDFSLTGITLVGMVGYGVGLVQEVWQLGGLFRANDRNGAQLDIHTAGLVKMNCVKFTLYSALGIALWSFCLTFAGKILDDSWQKVEIYLQKYDTVVWIALGVAVLLFVIKIVIQMIFISPRSPNVL